MFRPSLSCCRLFLSDVETQLESKTRLWPRLERGGPGAADRGAAEQTRRRFAFGWGFDRDLFLGRAGKWRPGHAPDFIQRRGRCCHQINCSVAASKGTLVVPATFLAKLSSSAQFTVRQNNLTWTTVGDWLMEFSTTIVAAPGVAALSQ
jgi:hypothetical protein